MRLGSPAKAICGVMFACATALPSPLPAAQQQPSPAPQAPAQSPKTGADPTDFITRIEPSYEHKRLDDGTQLDVFTVRSDLALRGDVSLRLDLPLVGYRPNDAAAAAGYERGFGVGDVVTQATAKPFATRHMAGLLGMRVDLNTASLPGLGQGGTTYAPVAAVGFFPNHRWVIAPVVQWYLGNDFDNAPLPGRRDRDELSIRVITIFQPGRPNLSYLLLDPEYVATSSATRTGSRSGWSTARRSAGPRSFCSSPRWDSRATVLRWTGASSSPSGRCGRGDTS